MDNKYKYGFIGCGNMGSALALAAVKSVGAENIVLCDSFSEKADALAIKTGATVKDTEYIASNCDYIFLGVKPQGYESLLSEIGNAIRSRDNGGYVLVSMAAGITISAVEALVGCECPVIRIMPNTPVSVGEGMILYSANSKISHEQLDGFIDVMSQAGRLDAITEDKIDAASAISGCGPAFACLFAEALADGAVECGLARDKALLYASQMLVGTARLIIESGRHPADLKDAVCSPGGTTIAGVHALENGAFRADVMNAVVAAYKKTLELKK